MSSNNAIDGTKRKNGAHFASRIGNQNSRSKKTTKKKERRGITGRSNDESSGKKKGAAQLGYATNQSHPLKQIDNIRAEEETKFAQVVGLGVKNDMFQWDASNQILTCGRNAISWFCDEETGVGISEKTFSQFMYGIGFAKKETNDQAHVYVRSDGKFDPDDATKLGQLSVGDCNRGSDTGKGSVFSAENVADIVSVIWENRKNIKSLTSFFGNEDNLASLSLTGRNGKSVVSKMGNLFGTTSISKILVLPLFLRIKDNGASAVPKSHVKPKSKKATSAAAKGAEDDVPKPKDKRKTKTTSSASANAANGDEEDDVPKKKTKTEQDEANLKLASDKSTKKKMKTKAASTKKKSALDDSMNLSDYSSDEDEAASPKKFDWDQLEMNSDEESYNSCDEDCSSDEAALPWPEKDDEEWKP